MGCHTWFQVPYAKGKEQIIELAREKLAGYTDEELSPSNKEMYAYAIEKELIDPVCELASAGNFHDNWTLYMDVEDYDLERYNRENGTSYSKYDKINDVHVRDLLESYSDEPRIGGYPDRIVRSCQDMVDFMTTGFDSDGKHFDFHYEESRKESFMGGIVAFFERHPAGIIRFG